MITWEMAFRVWFHFFWRYLLWGLLSAFCIGLLGGIVALGTHVDKMTMAVAGMALAMPVGALVKIWVIRNVLETKNRIGKYRLVLIDNEDAI